MSDYYSAEQRERSYIAKTLGALLEAEAASMSPQLRSLAHRTCCRSTARIVISSFVNTKCTLTDVRVRTYPGTRYMTPTHAPTR
eukprot:SAG31_NODE_1069_length_10077_cov_2.403588_6_plen_84_part_00